MVQERKTCRATKRDGSRCTSVMVNANGFCYAHDPVYADERKEMQAKGGRHKARLIQLKHLSPPRLLPIYDRLERALEQVHDGKLDPRQAQAMATLARALAAILQTGEIEQRVRDLEASAGRTREWRLP
jgi:Family of unknown function (DUF5763)